MEKAPRPRRRGFVRGPLGIGLLAAVVVVGILIALATIPVGHSLRYSASVFATGTVHAIFAWTWSFPGPVDVTVTWSGPAGATTNLTAWGVSSTGVFFQNGTSGTFSFTASVIPYVFQMTVDGVDVNGAVTATASYEAPIL